MTGAPKTDNRLTHIEAHRVIEYVREHLIFGDDGDVEYLRGWTDTEIADQVEFPCTRESVHYLRHGMGWKLKKTPLPPVTPNVADLAKALDDTRERLGHAENDLLYLLQLHCARLARLEHGLDVGGDVTQTEYWQGPFRDDVPFEHDGSMLPADIPATLES